MIFEVQISATIAELSRRLYSSAAPLLPVQ